MPLQPLLVSKQVVRRAFEHDETLLQQHAAVKRHQHGAVVAIDDQRVDAVSPGLARKCAARSQLHFGARMRLNVRKRSLFMER